MPDRSGFAHGTPGWIDIGSTDLDTTHAFYTGLFGWQRQDAGPVEQTGGYGFYLLDGKMVCGYGPAQDPAGAVWWTTYVIVDDADAVMGAVAAGGGSVVVAPQDVMDAGRMAIFTDPAGAALALWQPGAHRGAQVVNEPGALSWNELLSRDLAGAREFYPAVFGWTERNGADAPYLEFEVDGSVVAGAMAMPEEVPAEAPSLWNVYFGTADVDAAAARVTELGGALRQAPFEIPGVGRAAVVAGPLGEGFSLFEFAG